MSEVSYADISRSCVHGNTVDICGVMIRSSHIVCTFKFNVDCTQIHTLHRQQIPKNLDRNTRARPGRAAYSSLPAVVGSQELHKTGEGLE